MGTLPTTPSLDPQGLHKDKTPGWWVHHDPSPSHCPNSPCVDAGLGEVQTAPGGPCGAAGGGALVAGVGAGCNGRWR